MIFTTAVRRLLSYTQRHNYYAITTGKRHSICCSIKHNSQTTSSVYVKYFTFLLTTFGRTTVLHFFYCVCIIIIIITRARGLVVM
jgi:hypothetical protein